MLTVNDNEKQCVAHLLPCKIEHNGEANIEQYFIVEKQSNVHVSHFRGRRLEGRAVQLDADFKAHLITKNMNDQWIASLPLDEIIEWHADSLPTEFVQSSLETAIQWLPLTKIMSEHVEIS